MVDNTDEERLDNPTNNQSENPLNKINSTNYMETVNPKQESENAEVNKHPHLVTPKKKWGEHLREFTKLFLAVFLGFIANNIREHGVEKNRAKDLAKSFYQELKNDSITAGVKVQNRLKQEAALKYMIRYFRDSNLTNVPKEFALNFQYGIAFRSPSLFEPRIVMLEQLRNSGSLRYFKNDEFQALTGELTVAIKNVYDRQELESRTRLLYITPLIIQQSDYDFNTAMEKNDKTIFEGVINYEKSAEIVPFHLNEPDKIDRKNTVRYLSYYLVWNLSSTRQIHLKKYQDVNARLLQILRTDYHLN